MSISDDKTRTILSIEKDLKSKLESLAQKDDRSFNNYIIQIFKEHVKKMEDKNIL